MTNPSALSAAPSVTRVPSGKIQAKPVAIVGIACRFPGGASSLENYWRILKSGTDATCRVPASRWSIKRYYDPDRNIPGKADVRRGGFLREPIDRFDARFFGISPREAIQMDPQQRLILEVTWEAMEDAGIIPGELKGSRTGVYMGGFTMDNKIHLLNVYNRETITTHTAIGSTAGMLANRVSYTFDLHGPSMTVDTACSSSLVALHLACRDLSDGVCGSAVVGGVNIMLRPEYTIAMSKGGFLSSDGRCKAFDASADGYGRGEGAGVLILKPLEAALESRDNIHALIVGSGINQDGRSDGITAPNPAAQARLLTAVYAAAGIEPDHIQYVEAHGTGTRAGDLAEATSLGKAISTRRKNGNVLWVGSAKTNIGHLEAAAGVAGVIKAVLTLKHKTIPGNLHYKVPHPEINFDALRLRVPVKATPWPRHAGPAGVGVNAFGYGGTNAHVILQESPNHRPAESPSQHNACIIPISAASRISLLARIRQISEVLETRPQLALQDVGYTLTLRQTHHAHRLVLVASNMAELRNGLYPFNQRQSDHASNAPQPQQAKSRRKCAFIYCGMGPQYRGMGAKLLAGCPDAARVLDDCDAIWRTLSGKSLKALFSDHTGDPMVDPITAQPAGIVLQLMLTEVARQYGLTPDGILGHSVGEIAAACAGGSLSLKDALTITYHRSRLQQRIAGAGKMMAAELSPDQAAAYVQSMPGRLSIAAINSHRAVTLAGEPDTIRRLAEILTRKAVFHRILKVNVAYHSYQMDPLESDFMAAIPTFEPTSPRIPLYSSVNGNKISTALQTTAYWWRNARQSVCFAAAIEQMIKDGYNTFVEIGPHPVLAPAIKDALARIDTPGATFASLTRTDKDSHSFVAVIARLYAHGVALNWRQQYAGGNLVRLGPYPWDRETLWLETPASKADRLGVKGHPLLSPKEDDPRAVWEGELTPQVHGYLKDHQIQGEMIFPGAGFVEMALAARGASTAGKVIEALSFHHTLAIAQSPIVRLCFDADNRRFSIYSRSRITGSAWVRHASGTILRLAPPPAKTGFDPTTVKMRCDAVLDVQAFYQECDRCGLRYGPAFRTIAQGYLGRKDALTRLEVMAQAQSSCDAADYFVYPPLLDGAFQSLLALWVTAGRTEQGAFIPVGIGQVRFFKKPGPAVWCHASITARAKDVIQGNISCYDDHGTACLEIVDVSVRAIPIRRKDPPGKKNYAHYPLWLPQKLALQKDSQKSPANWLIFSDTKEIGNQVAQDAARLGISCIKVAKGRIFKQIDPYHFEIPIESRPAMQQLMECVSADSLDAVIYLWAIDIIDQDSSRYDPQTQQRSATGMVDVVNLTHLIQALERSVDPLDQIFCIGLVRAQRIAPQRGVCRSPGQQALIGFGRVLAMEYPDLHIKLLDLNSLQPMRCSADLIQEIQSGNMETEIAIRSGTRYVNRLVNELHTQDHFTAGPQSAYELKQAQAQWVEIPRTPPQDNEIELAVHACTLVTAQAAEENGTRAQAKVQLHCAGVITATGRQVTRYQKGQAVAVLIPCKKICSFMTVAQTYIIPIPPNLSLQQATHMANWISAYHALFHLGKLKAGDRVLVLHGARDVSLTAIQLATWRGAVVYTAEQTKESRDYLRSAGIDHISNSDSLKLCDDVSAWTQGKGLDLVLGSVSAELLQKSVELLSPGGIFVQVGAKNTPRQEQIPLGCVNGGRRIYTVDIKQLCQKEPQTIHKINRRLARAFSDQSIHSLPGETLSTGQVKTVCRRMSEGRTIRKTTVNLHGESVGLSERLLSRSIHADAGYIVSGGFSGLGLATLKWLAQNGARYIAVLSRSGPVSADARDSLHALETSGIKVLSLMVDITIAPAVSAAVEEIRRQFPGIKGVIHSAAELDDGMISTLRASQIHAAMAAKALGGLNLHHCLAAEPLDFFICYGSIAGLLGNPGQANYAAANTYLDGLMQYRRDHGDRGLSINWGVIKDVGMVARDRQLGTYLQRFGMVAISVEQGLEEMTRAIVQNRRQVGIFKLDWEKWADRFQASKDRFSMLDLSTSRKKPPAEMFRNTIFGLDAANRFEAIYANVIRLIATILGIHSSRIEKDRPLQDLGIDSLLATELAERIRAETGIRFRSLYILRGPTPGELSQQILDALFSSDDPQGLIAVQ